MIEPNSNNFELVSLNMRMATDEDAHLPTYDHTKLSAINTCPTWGILRYSLHKRMPNASRALPLEAGSAAHEAFAAVRWFQYFTHQCKEDTQYNNAMYHGKRLFGEDRFSRMYNTLSTGSTERTNCINFAIEAIETCGFYDDITDNRRTISNISESIISYIDAYDMKRYPIWVRDPTDPKSDIGIEISFDIVVDIQYIIKVPEYEQQSDGHTLKVRHTGKLDGLHWNKSKLFIYEEKTASRPDDVWLAQWILSHQITGYCLAASTFTELDCNNAMVGGMRIPIGKIPAEGIRREQVNRNNHMYEKWANWFVTTITTEQQYINDVISAPMFTHSCSRYFRSCSFMAFCGCESKEEKLAVIEEMEHDKWSPLDES